MSRVRTVLLLGAIALLSACSSQTQSPPHRYAPSAAPQEPGTATPEALGVIDIKAVGGEFQPSSVTVPRAGRYQVNLTHGGLVAHNLHFEDGTVIVAGQSSSGTGFIDVPAKGMRYWCSLPGHTEVGVISVAAESFSPAPTTSD